MYRLGEVGRGMAREITSKIQTPLDGPTHKFSVHSSEIDLQCSQSQVIASVAGMDTGQILLYPPGLLSPTGRRKWGNLPPPTSDRTPREIDADPLADPAAGVGGGGGATWRGGRGPNLGYSQN